MTNFQNPFIAGLISAMFISSCQSTTESSPKTAIKVAEAKYVESSAQPSHTTSLQDAFTAAQGGAYVAPTAMALREAEALFIRTLQGESSLDLQNAWQAQGFTLHTLTDNGTAFTVVQEVAEKRTGRGFYVFRQTNPLPIALQAPHSYKDLYTGTIAIHLMREGHYSAAGWNTVKRDDADMAHLDNTIFQAFGRALAHQYPTVRLVQLHGFAQDKRTTATGKTTDLILSGTTLTPSQHLLKTAHCLKAKLTEFVVRTYPNEISELGGTTNSNAKDLRKLGFNRFFHVELSKPLREQLRQSQQVRQMLSACLENGE